MEKLSWKLIETYFEENPDYLVSHHLESYNSFFNKGIHNIFKENNPIRFIEREDKSENVDSEKRNECLLYLGGKDGSKLYFGKPIIYDDDRTHYMYPNDARLRNMTYGTTIHYDVDVEILYYDKDTEEEPKRVSYTLEKIYLGRFPIMLQSDLCILKSLAPEVRFNMGECRNDYGGYFIIDGKEKVIMSQEKFADNMLYVRKNKSDDVYSHSAEIRSVSEDASKPIRTTSVRMVAPSTQYSNQQIVVDVPNVKKPVPLFILMRALGVTPDEQIIETCLLDLEANSSYVDLFIPSVHDANLIFNQETALEYIASFTKRETINSVLDILMNFFLPHIGEKNFLDKAYFVGYMVNRMLKVVMQEEKPTDRDSFLFKRVELSGTLVYDLFREYFLIQKREISKKIDNEYYYHTGKYKESFLSLIQDNYVDFFKDRVVESGFKKAFKGAWGSQENTRRQGVVQDLNRLSWFTFISHLRKIILPLDASAKVVGPRHLNSSQWGFIDPVDTPDGGHIGLHKHLAICTLVTSGTSALPMIQWLRGNTKMMLLQECTPQYISRQSKVFVNGKWIGVVENPLEMTHMMKLFRRNGVLPVYTSIRFDRRREEINIYTDSGRLIRPVYYVDKGQTSFQRKETMQDLAAGKLTWQQIVSGTLLKPESVGFSYKAGKTYDVADLYPAWQKEQIEDQLERYKALIDYVDTSEEEGALVATYLDDLKRNKLYTHMEIDPSLILGVMGNSIIFPEHNQFPRDVFSCGQSRQAVSVYHSNYPVRIDKMGVILQYGQTPLVKSKYLEHINKEQQPYGINAIVAIMSYTGYNVEDAILIYQGAVDRGLLRTTYFSMYEAREESAKIAGTTTNSVFTDIANSKKKIVGLKPGYDYSYLDEYGMIQENTALHDKIVLIGKATSSVTESDVGKDNSVVPKKGQLGFVDKVFLTEGEEGTKLAKVRIREERIPALGDKMASRAGQKGTLGLIIAEEDMPFTSDGIRPDLIINPHALPSRMTIGQLVESLLGKVCLHYGGFGDCTAFTNKGAHTKVYGANLVEAGFSSTGNQLLYNGMSGEALQADIYIGPTYYMRLKHMVKDKINYRARGPRTALTRQPVQGRANDGGLRIGEMERDGVLAHGASHFLNESFMIRGDEYFIAVCNKTGCLAVYNESKNLFLSPQADGPLQFHKTHEGTLNLDKVTRFGRSFSLLRVPYAFKLLMQELLVMNVQMRLITEDNVDQLTSMSYSNNIVMLTQQDKGLYPSEIADQPDEMKKYKFLIKRINQAGSKAITKPLQEVKQDSSSLEEERKTEDFTLGSPINFPLENVPSPVYDPNKPVSASFENRGPFREETGTFETPPYAPESPEQMEMTLKEIESSLESFPQETNTEETMNSNNIVQDTLLQSYYDTLSEKNKLLVKGLPTAEQRERVLKKLKDKNDARETQTAVKQVETEQQKEQEEEREKESTKILHMEEEKKEEKSLSSRSEENDSSSSEGSKKTITFGPDTK